MSEENKKIIEKKVNEHRGELVITQTNTIGMLLGWTEDEEDYYYVIWDDFRSDIILYSCVGRFTPLKGKIDDSMYKYFEDSWKLNQPPYHWICLEFARRYSKYTLK